MLARVKLVFSERGGTDYHVMRDYQRLLRDGREMYKPVRTIKWAMLDIDGIKVETHRKWAGLQFADCITSAFLAAVEPNRYGNYEPRYAQALKGALIHNNGSHLNSGLAPVPSFFKSQLDERQLAFFLSFAKLGG